MLLQQDINRCFEKEISKYTLKFRNNDLENNWLIHRHQPHLLSTRLCIIFYYIFLCGVTIMLFVKKETSRSTFFLITLLSTSILEVFVRIFKKTRFLRGVCLILNCITLLSGVSFEGECKASNPYQFPALYFIQLDLVFLSICEIIILGLRVCDGWIQAALSHATCIIYILARAHQKAEQKNFEMDPIRKFFLINLAIVSSVIVASFIYYSNEYSHRKIFFLSSIATKEKQQWKNIMNNIPDGILLTKQKQILLYNPALTDILGIQEDPSRIELIQNQIEKKINTQVEDEEPFESMITEEEQFLYLGNYVFMNNFQHFDISSRNFICSIENNQSISIECRFLHIVLFGDECLLTIFKDQTTYKALQEERTTKKNEKKFFFNITHELRTPLNSIIGMTELLAGSISDKSHLDSLKVIKSSSILLLHLINDILDLAQIEAKSFKVFPKKFHLKEILQEIMDLFAFQASKKGIELKIEIESGTPSHVKADPNRYKQIILNLISNALKFTEEGLIKIAISYHNSNYLLITKIQDTGVGISNEDQSKLFQVFSKITSTSLLNVQGVGLGLTICKQLTELMGGKISIESEIGKGTKFTFSISDISEDHQFIKTQFLRKKTLKEKSFKMKLSDSPNIISSENSSNHLILKETVTDELEIPQNSQNSLIKCKCNPILIVDDDQFNLFTLNSLLNNFNFHADEAVNGKKAITLLETSNKRKCCSPYKLILMDLNMPGMGGDEASKSISEKIQKNEILPTSIIGLTGEENEETTKHCLNCGMKELYTKPLNMNKLQKILEKYL